VIRSTSARSWQAWCATVPSANTTATATGPGHVLAAVAAGVAAQERREFGLSLAQAGQEVGWGVGRDPHPAGASHAEAHAGRLGLG
jgi:hypothetical protein